MKKLYLIAAFATGLIPSTSMAQEMTKAQVEQIVQEYIENNPQVILDSVESYGRRQQEAEMAAQQEAVEEHMGWLENNDMLPVAGNPDGDVTVVEFFDYNCGYCKKALSDVMELLESDDNLKFIFVDTPILGRTSELAAKWALAAKEQDAYLEYHVALMESSGMITEERLASIAEGIGLDVDKMRETAESPEVAAKIAEKASKAAQMGISGTPAFIIGGKLFGGYIGVDRMRQAVEEARESSNED